MNFYHVLQGTEPGQYIWLLMPMWIRPTIDAVRCNATYIANGKRAKAILKNSLARASLIYRA
jgi:hypothetical protein